MRTNIVLNEQLVVEALKLSGKKSKREIVDFALQRLVKSLKQQAHKNKDFIADYIDQPIKLDNFTPLDREDIYDR